MRGQDDWQWLHAVQSRRVDLVQGFQEGVETVSYFSQIWVLYLQAHCVPKGYNFFFGQVGHGRLQLGSIEFCCLILPENGQSVKGRVGPTLRTSARFSLPRVRLALRYSFRLVILPTVAVNGYIMTNLHFVSD